MYLGSITILSFGELIGSLGKQPMDVAMRKTKPSTQKTC